jgi:hypothetical protein
VMTEFAAIQASSPTLTGASKTVFTPVLTLRPILVRSFSASGSCLKFAVTLPAATFAPSPTSASPMYDRCGIFAEAPTAAFLTSTNVPIFAPSPITLTGRTYADLGPALDPDAAADHRVRMDYDVGLDLDAGLDPRRPGIDDRHAGKHVLFIDPVAEGGRGQRELGARVDALGIERIAREEDGARLAVGDEQPESVRDVQLALGVVCVEPLERRPELVGAKDVDAGVDLAHGQLLGGGVGRLDDPGEPAVGVADDPTVGAGICGLEGEDGGGRAGLAMGLDERANRLGP